MDYLTMWESGMNSPAKGGAASGGFFFKALLGMTD
jgi:hypothetical protein